MRKTLAAILFAALAPGCASQLTELRGVNHQLNEQVGSLRAELRGDQDQIRDLQNQIFVLKDKLETAEVAAGKTPGAVPRLPVEVLAPRGGAGAASAAIDPPAGDSDLGDVSDLGDDARVVAVADDGTQIIYTGDAARGKPAPPPDPSDLADAGGGGTSAHAPAASGARRATPPKDLAPVPTVSDRLGVDREVPKVSAVAGRRPAPSSRPTRTAAASPAPAPAHDGDVHDPRADYQAAVDALRAGDHAAAIAGLREFLRRWPDHDYADNAQYWLGESYYDQRDYRRALDEFKKTVERYPRGNKVPDALLKVGFCYAALGQTEQARATLEQVVAVYPKSGPAQIAATRLDTLGK